MNRKFKTINEVCNFLEKECDYNIGMIKNDSDNLYKEFKHNIGNYFQKRTDDFDLESMYRAFLSYTGVKLLTPTRSAVASLVPITQVEQPLGGAYAMAVGDSAGAPRLIKDDSDDAPVILNTVNTSLKKIQKIGGAIIKPFSLIGNSVVTNVQSLELAKRSFDRELDKIIVEGLVSEDGNAVLVEGLSNTSGGLHKKAPVLTKGKELEFLNSAVVNFNLVDSKYYRAKAVIIPMDMWLSITSTFKGNNETLSILASFNLAFPEVTVYPDTNSVLGSAYADKGRVIIVGDAGSDVFRFIQTTPLTILPPEARNFKEVINMSIDIAGLEVVDNRALESITFTK